LLHIVPERNSDFIASLLRAGIIVNQFRAGGTIFGLIAIFNLSATLADVSGQLGHVEKTVAVKNQRSGCAVSEFEQRGEGDILGQVAIPSAGACADAFDPAAAEPTDNFDLVRRLAKVQSSWR
jgi:hypothetical protein